MVRINEPAITKPTSDRLTLLYRISQTINSSLDLDQVMETLMDEVIAATKAERGFLMEYGEGGQLNFRTARGMDQQTLEDSEFKISRSIVERVGREGIPLLASNAQVDERLDNRASVRLYGLRSVLCAPIQLKERILGVIYVDNRFQDGIFSQADLDLLSSLASSAGIAIENARLYQIAIEKGRMQRELQMAREVQISLIPPETPHLPGWEFAACWKPANEVSGDFYDFIPLPSGKLGFIVADVSDKGMPAAMFMALSRSIIRSVAGQNGFPSEDITKANRLICQDAAEGMFITLFYAEIDPHNHLMTYVNAGHNPPFFIKNQQKKPIILKRTGMAAGVESDIKYQQKTVEFSPGDVLLIYTDGVIDARKEDTSYGLENLKKTLIQYRGVSVDEMIAGLETEICDFVGTDTPFDDITLLAVKRIS